MNLPLIYTSYAVDDFLEIIQKYENLSQKLAGRFRIEHDRTADRIKAFPAMYGYASKRVRAGHITKYPYYIFYFVSTHNITVIAIFHHRRSRKQLALRLKQLEEDSAN
jgi:plasmid stabilization system protein ParE